jgi:hypothetical protein
VDLQPFWGGEGPLAVASCPAYHLRTVVNEKRAHKRIPVMMWVEEVREEATYFQRSGNLSMGGLWLDGTIPHPRDTKVQLRFNLPGEEEVIEVRGVIVGDPDEEHLGMHVKFEGLSSDLEARLRSFVEQAEGE